MFDFLQKYLMGPMGKIAQLKIVRAVMAAGWLLFLSRL